MRLTLVVVVLRVECVSALGDDLLAVAPDGGTELAALGGADGKMAGPELVGAWGRGGLVAGSTHWPGDGRTPDSGESIPRYAPRSDWYGCACYHSPLHSGHYSIAAGKGDSPIFGGTWNGTGICQALGGTWNAANHQFTVSAVQAGSSGAPVTIDPAQQQRILVSDIPTGWTLGGSFLATASSSTLTCTAAAISGETLTSLNSLLPTGDTVLSGWNLSATSGYTAGDPGYLSFDVGHAQLLDDLQVWQYGGSDWTSYSAIDLTYDRTYASFAVTALGTYAVTGDLVLMGDANRDGTTNGVDLNTVLSNYNRTGMDWSQGDFTGDGTVNGADLNTVLSNYNQSLPVRAAVPEPSALALLSIGAAGLAGGVWRRWKRGA
jgi:hypothetical protein